MDLKRAHVERPAMLAILMGGLGHDVLDAAKKGENELVIELSNRLRYMADRMQGCAMTEGDKATLRQALLAAERTVRTAEDILKDKLRGQRLGDKNRPAYRRIESARPVPGGRS